MAVMFDAHSVVIVRGVQEKSDSEKMAERKKQRNECKYKTDRRAQTERERKKREGVLWRKKIKNNIPENRSCPASRPHPVRRGIKN